MPPIPDNQWSSLVSEIRRIANSVAIRKNASPTVRDELLAAAVEHIYDKRDKFDPARASFNTWCWTVLANLCVDLIAREAAERRRRARYRSAEEYRQEQQLRPTRPKSTGDEDDETEDQRRPRPDLLPLLEARLTPMDRLLVATYAGVLGGFDRDVVDRWCREAACDHAADLLRVATIPQRERMRAVAETLGRKLDWVRTRMYRAFRDLRGGEDGQ